MIKKGDIIIICIIFILACIGMYFTNVEKETSMKIIEVFHDGKIVASYKVDCNFDKKFDFHLSSVIRVRVHFASHNNPDYH